MAQLIGKATVTVDGQRMEMERGAKANPGGTARQFERHLGKTYARDEEVPPSVEGMIMLTADTDVVALSNVTNATVMFECDTGQKYVLRGASTENPVEIDAGAGKSAIKFVGDSFDLM